MLRLKVNMLIGGVWHNAGAGLEAEQVPRNLRWKRYVEHIQGPVHFVTDEGTHQKSLVKGFYPTEARRILF